MHVHQSLFKGEKNAFFDPADNFHLSEIAKYYIAGLMRHAPEIDGHDQPMGQLLQAIGAGVRSPGLCFLGAQKPFYHDPGSHVQTGKGKGHPDRIPIS